MFQFVRVIIFAMVWMTRCLFIRYDEPQNDFCNYIERAPYTKNKVCSKTTWLAKSCSNISSKDPWREITVSTAYTAMKTNSLVLWPIWDLWFFLMNIYPSFCFPFCFLFLLCSLVIFESNCIQDTLGLLFHTWQFYIKYMQ